MQVVDVTYVGYVDEIEVCRFTLESVVEEDPDYEQMVEDRQTEMEVMLDLKDVYWDRE